MAIAFSGDLPDGGMEPVTPAFQADCVPSEPQWKPQLNSVYDKLSQCRICLQCRRQIQSLGQGRYPGEGNGKPLQYSCLENPMDAEAWQGSL